MTADHVYRNNVMLRFGHNDEDSFLFSFNFHVSRKCHEAVQCGCCCFFKFGHNYLCNINTDGLCLIVCVDSHTHKQKLACWCKMFIVYVKIQSFLECVNLQCTLSFLHDNV